MTEKTAFIEATDRCTAGRLLRAVRKLTRQYDEALRPTGLSITQFSILGVIGRVEPESISELADLLSLDRTTASRNLNTLEKAGLVFRGSEGTGRKRRLLLTTAGVEKYEEAFPYWKAVQEKIEGALGEGGLADLKASLRRLG